MATRTLLRLATRAAFGIDANVDSRREITLHSDDAKSFELTHLRTRTAGTITL
jgi:hypothetical protein